MYIKTKEQARQYAIGWQRKIIEGNFSYGDIIRITNKLKPIAKKFGLIKEFKENGLI